MMSAKIEKKYFRDKTASKLLKNYVRYSVQTLFKLIQNHEKSTTQHDPRVKFGRQVERLDEKRSRFKGVVRLLRHRWKSWSYDRSPNRSPFSTYTHDSSTCLGNILRGCRQSQRLPVSQLFLRNVTSYLCSSSTSRAAPRLE